MGLVVFVEVREVENVVPRSPFEELYWPPASAHSAWICFSEIALAGAAARRDAPATRALAATSRAAAVIRRRRAGEVCWLMIMGVSFLGCAATRMGRAVTGRSDRPPEIPHLFRTAMSSMPRAASGYVCCHTKDEPAQ